jgi:hypothetical protein
MTDNEEGSAEDARGGASALTERARRRGWLAVVFAGGLLVASAVFEHTPVDGFVLCPFRALTGYSCFGCGMTRACVSAVHGSWWTSLTFHPFGLPFLLVVTLNGLHKLAQNVVGRPIRPPGWAFFERVRRPALWTIFAALLVFGIVRLALEIAGILTPI